MTIIRTVLGDIPAEQAGITLTHEHLRYAYAGCEYDHNNVWSVDVVAAQIGQTMRSGMQQHGIRTVGRSDAAGTRPSSAIDGGDATRQRRQHRGDHRVLW